MHAYYEIKKIYAALQDDISRKIFLKRLEYSLSGRKEMIAGMVDAEMAREGNDDIMCRLLRWLEERPERAGVTVFGAGFAGSQICSVLRRHGVRTDSIADNNRQLWGGVREDGIGIIPPDAIGRDSLVIIGVNFHAEEILEQLLSLGISRERIFMPDKQWWIGKYPQYFEPEIVRPGPEEVFVDGGSLDGGDTLNFIRWCKGSYRAVYAFEPDAESAGRLRENLKDCRDVHIFEEGLWSREANLHFSSGKAEVCAVSESGDRTVRVTSIDRRLEGQRVTFIKMDIEGSEAEALLGAADTIRRQKPKLAVCVYHKPEDILDIPGMILEINPEYRFYLRHYSYTDTETVLYAV